MSVLYRNTDLADCKPIQLHNFQYAVQGLGSGLDLAQSARRIRKYLSLTSWLIRENARKLFPLAVKAGDPPQLDGEHISVQRQLPSWPPVSAAQSNAAQHLDKIYLYKVLLDLAKSIEGFRAALEQFPEFDNFDTLRKIPLRSFESDLKVCLHVLFPTLSSCGFSSGHPT